MASYYIPSNKLKGENRILYIFTGKSFIFTAVGAIIGLIVFYILNLLGFKTAGIVVMVLLAALGYGISTIKVPAGGNSKLSKNVGGESLDEIIFHYVMFKKNKKVYSYAVPRRDPDYKSTSNASDLIDLIDSKVTKVSGTSADSNENNSLTKEDNN